MMKERETREIKKIPPPLSSVSSFMCLLPVHTRIRTRNQSNAKTHTRKKRKKNTQQKNDMNYDTTTTLSEPHFINKSRLQIVQLQSFAECLKPNHQGVVNTLVLVN